jgi:hypothetical protein
MKDEGRERGKRGERGKSGRVREGESERVR